MISIQTISAVSIALGLFLVTYSINNLFTIIESINLQETAVNVKNIQELDTIGDNQSINFFKLSATP
jgi:hypothetical protein